MGAGQAKHEWFKNQYGFDEAEVAGYKEIQRLFEFDLPTRTLKSRQNHRSFYVGVFETPSVIELQQAKNKWPPASWGGGLTFENLSGDIIELHLDKDNAGAVFQVASQFNCLQMVGPDISPENGLTLYTHDDTQGANCAIACPAATVYRNYLLRGRGQGGGNHRQVNTAVDLERILDNKANRYWRMKNGYMMPARQEAVKEISDRIAKEEDLREKLLVNGRVGIHWSTEVAIGAHRVTQVYCSPVPISNTNQRGQPKDWKNLAQVVLDSAYEATLLTAAFLARKRKERVTVFLTCVGSGTYCNPRAWICEAIEKALATYMEEALDVKLVHEPLQGPLHEDFLQLEDLCYFED